MVYLQASASDICAIVWSPSRPSLVMAVDSTSCMVLLELTSQICYPRLVSLADKFVIKNHRPDVTKVRVALLK